MRNKYNYDELVEVSGIGKFHGIVKNKLGIIVDKDTYYNDYYVDLFGGKKDWFKEKCIKRVLAEKKNKVEKYLIRLCTTKEGYDLIEKNIKENEPIKNNKFKKINIHRNFKRDNKKYIVIGWNSVFWPLNNKSIKIIENTIKSFRGLDIPFQYIVMNEERIKEIEINEFIENDNNVDVFFIERKLKTKKVGKTSRLGRRKDNKC